MVALSILDLVRVTEETDARGALDNARDLAVHAEQWGYRRFWVAEHHNMPGIASAATSVVIAHIAAGSRHIRVGAGGIMLPNHAPIVIAEQFGTLARLYPGRIDLGLGRAPGTDQITVQALRRSLVAADEFPQDVLELQAYFAPVQTGAQEGRFLTGRTTRPDAERLPPGQHLVRDWPVLDLGEQPDIALDTWRLAIDGAVAHPEILDWATFQSLPQSAKTSDIHCVTSWSRYDNGWAGVSTRDILDRVMPKAQARFVLLRSYDGYTTNITLEDFASEDAILAHSWEGKPLTRAHGCPVRLVVPHLYFWKSAKWLKRIEFATRDAPGFWEVNGYHNRADPCWNSAIRMIEPRLCGVLARRQDVLHAVDSNAASFWSCALRTSPLR